MSTDQQQSVPVRIYQSDNQIGVAAPVAGLEPEDITITIDGKRVAIRGKERGPRQHDLDLIVAEWSFGLYFREIMLPQYVEGSLANATYGNGVPVLMIPKMRPDQKPVRAEFTLEAIQPTRGDRVGHTGRDMRKMTTRQHLDAVAELQRRVA